MSLTLVTARHRPAPARGAFRSIDALVFEIGGGLATLRTVQRAFAEFLACVADVAFRQSAECWIRNLPSGKRCLPGYPRGGS